MILHIEVKDAEGYHHSKAMNIPELPRENPQTVMRQGMRQFANLARAKGWTEINVWHPLFPASKRMQRINLVQSKNGNPPLYTPEDIAAADHPGKDLTIAMFDKDGNVIPSMIVSPIGKTSQPELVPPANAGDASLKTIIINEHGADSGAALPTDIPNSPTAVAAPAVQQVVPAPGAAPAETMAAPAPIATR